MHSWTGGKLPYGPLLCTGWVVAFTAPPLQRDASAVFYALLELLNAAPLPARMAAGLAAMAAAAGSASLAVTAVAAHMSAWHSYTFAASIVLAGVTCVRSRAPPQARSGDRLLSQSNVTGRKKRAKAVHHD